jgi:hypothetical protein
MFPGRRQFPHLGGKFFEGRFDFGRQGLLQDFPMLRLGRPAVQCGAAFEPAYQVVIQVSDLQVSGQFILRMTSLITMMSPAIVVKLYLADNAFKRHGAANEIINL